MKSEVLSNVAKDFQDGHVFVPIVVVDDGNIIAEDLSQADL